MNILTALRYATEPGKGARLKTGDEGDYIVLHKCPTCREIKRLSVHTLQLEESLRHERDQSATTIISLAKLQSYCIQLEERIAMLESLADQEAEERRFQEMKD